MFRRLASLLLLAVSLHAAVAPEEDPRGYERVEVAPTKTSIYLGYVKMTMAPFVRSGATYAAAYEATVIPYFFANEKGRLTVDLTAAQLNQLARNEPIDFTGRAVRDDGAERRVEGKATPDDPRHGRLKVRVFVSRRIQLIFNTTYRFTR